MNLWTWSGGVVCVSSASSAESDVIDQGDRAFHLEVLRGGMNRLLSALVQEALRSPGATFLPDKTAGRFIVETDLGRSIGTKGETWLKVVITDGGDIITAYPVKR